MAKNLMSRIGKLALIPALAFSLNTGKIQAQEKKFNTDFNLYIGPKVSHYPEFKVPEDWQSHFRDLDFYYGNYGKGIKLKSTKFPFGADVLTIGFNSYFKLKNGLEVGTSVEGGFQNLRCLNRVSQAKVFFGKDYERSFWVKDLTLLKLSPNFGPFIRIPVKNNKFLEFKLTTTPYKLYERDYEGMIILGGYISQKSNRTYKENFVDKGWSSRITINFLAKKLDGLEEGRYIGCYFEKMRKATQFGISIGGYVNINK